MRWFYSTFPDGLPGFGLLLLRLVLGASLIQASARMLDPAGIGSWTWAPGLLALLTAISFLLGFLTPVAGAVCALVGLAIRLWPHMPDPYVASLYGTNTIVIALAIALVGPGAFSMDARFFGRRRIIVPRITHS